MVDEHVVTIAVLDADIPVPAVLSVRGSYGDIFADLLQTVSQKYGPSPTPRFIFKGFDVVNHEYPANVEDFDGILITGSSASAYDTQPWVGQLNAFIQATYSDYPRVRLFGSCFGHQIISQALLAPFGVRVTKDPKGWEIGVHNVHLTSEFAAYANTTVQGKRDLRLQFIHADHVVIPEASLPADWIVLGSSRHCAVQGVLQPGRVMTFQGHFEFDRFISTETVKIFGALWDERVREDALRAIDEEDDSEVAATIVAEFLAGGWKTTGLLTPPEELRSDTM